jgi:hypothetical protein
MFAFLSLAVKSQDLKSLVNSVTKKDGISNLTNTDIVSGLKEALQKGTLKGTDQLAAVDGFFKNAAVKILMPAEAQKVESTLRGMGLGKQVDDAILLMNRAAEDASKKAAPIFVDAIKQMTITDAVNILKGNDTAATSYLKSKTSAALTTAFKPTIDSSLEKVGATKAWNTVFTSYNKIPFVKKVNTDLSNYVTDKALTGVFYQIAMEEQNIRKNPVARTTEILKKVFGAGK